MVDSKRGIPALVVVAGALLMSAPAQAEVFLVHGNWCGSGNRSLPGLGPLPPVDPLDMACMRHDICYERRGSMTCGCDLEFMNELSWMKYPTAHLSVKARAMYDAVAMVPCAGTDAMYKPAYFLGQLASDFFAGRAGPWEVPLRMGYMLSHSY